MASPASADKIANLKLGGRTLGSDEYIQLVNDAIDKNVKGVLERLGLALVDELTKLAPVGATGNLASGIKVIGVQQNEDGLYRLEVGFGAEYTDYIDKGVEGVDPSKRKTILKNSEGRKYKFKTYGMPQEAINSLKNWARAKNIQMSKDSGGSKKKFKSKKKAMSEDEKGARRLAFLIKKEGIAARNFQAKAFKNVGPKYQAEIESLGFNSLILKIAQ
jgi:hypothetical protein